MKHDYAKVAFIGDASVGKTTLVNTICHKNCSSSGPTIGACCEIKDINCPNGNNVKALIWDTAGQERFRSIAPIYMRNSNIIVLVFDVNNIISFNNLKDWIILIRDNCDPYLLLIVGNKIDLPNRTVKKMDALAFSNEYNCTYCECSALSKEGSQQVWNLIKIAIDELCLTESVQQMETMDLESPTSPKICCTIS